MTQLYKVKRYQDRVALPAEQLFHAARLWAFAVSVVELEDLTPAGMRERDEYVNKAVAMLRQAIEKDYLDRPNAAAELRTHPELNPLRDRPEFHQLLKEVGVQ
jgi:hypothetical protein